MTQMGLAPFNPSHDNMSTQMHVFLRMKPAAKHLCDNNIGTMRKTAGLGLGL